MASGTVTSDATEQVAFTTQSGPGFLFWYIDLNPMVSGDTVTIREKIDVNNTGVFSEFQTVEYTGAQTNSVVSQSANLLTDETIPVRVTIQQTGGSFKTYQYAYGVKF